MVYSPGRARQNLLRDKAIIVVYVILERRFPPYAGRTGGGFAHVRKQARIVKRASTKGACFLAEPLQPFISRLRSEHKLHTPTLAIHQIVEFMHEGMQLNCFGLIHTSNNNKGL